MAERATFPSVSGEMLAGLLDLPVEILVGHSLGGAAVIAAAKHVPQGHPHSFVSLEGSDHLLTAPGQARRAARIISAWADQDLAE